MDLQRQLTSFLRVPERVTLLFAGRADGTAAPVTPADPLPVIVVSGAGSDPDAARETTLQQVRDGITALAALLGSTDNLEGLLSTQATYLDQVESLLTTLGGQTDGLEGLLSALGVKNDANVAKLEQLRLLLANIDTHGQAANGNSFILANQAQGDGLRVQRLTVTNTYPPQVLAPGTEQALTVPAGANRALLRVVAGQARFGLGNTTDTPLVDEGGGLDDLRDAQLGALRVTVEEGGAVRVDYWREGTHTLEVM